MNLKKIKFFTLLVLIFCSTNMFAGWTEFNPNWSKDFTPKYREEYLKLESEYRKSFVDNLEKRDFPYLAVLFNDLAFYETREDLFNMPVLFYHRVDLAWYSVLVAQHIETGCSFFDPKIDLREGLSEREKYILNVTGLIHDIGKAGEPNYKHPDPDPKQQSKNYQKDDGKIAYISKDGHARLGFEFIAGSLEKDSSYPKYEMVDGSTFDFKNLLGELFLEENERKIVAILIGAHQIYDGVIASFLEKKFGDNRYQDDKPKTVETFLRELKKLADDIDLPRELFNKNLIQQVLVITIAVKLGVFFGLPDGNNSILGEFKDPPKRRPFATDRKFMGTLTSDSELEAKSQYVETVLNAAKESFEETDWELEIEKILK